MEKLEFRKQKLKEKYLGKLFVKARNEEQYKSPKISIFFDFSKTLKQYKDRSFEALKHFLKLVKNTSESRNFSC